MKADRTYIKTKNSEGVRIFLVHLTWNYPYATIDLERFVKALQTTRILLMLATYISLLYFSKHTGKGP